MLNILIKSAQLLGAIKVFRLVFGHFPAAAVPDFSAYTFGKTLSNNAVEITVKLPALRSDRITPLVNLNGLKLFHVIGYLSDQSKLKLPIPARPIRVYDTVAAKGYYTYFAVAVDNSETRANRITRALIERN